MLTLVGVVLAIGSFVALVSVATGFTQRVERELGSREVHIYVTANRSSTLPVSPLAGAGGSGVSLPRDLEESLKVDGVRSITPVIRSSLDGPRSVIPVLGLPLDQVPIVFKGGRFSNDPTTLEAKSAVEVLTSPTATPSPTPSAVTPTPEPTPTKVDGTLSPSSGERLIYPAGGR